MLLKTAGTMAAKLLRRNTASANALLKKSLQEEKTSFTTLEPDDIESWEYVDEPTVYDIEVENNHNYFLDVGKPVLVHNSSKTHSALQFLYFLARNIPRKLIISVVSESGPHLKRGAMRDFFNIVGPVYNEAHHNKTDWEYYINQSTIEFFSADNPAKMRGSRRDILFINECNNIPKETRDQLEVRTKWFELLDFNPVQRFWAHELENKPGVAFHVSTYKDNQFLDPRIIQSIENRKGMDPNWWRVYGMGLVGKIEGLLFPDFELIDEMPDIQTDLGLDFGFSNDPTALIEVGIQGDYIYMHEWIYERFLTNPDIVSKMRGFGITKNYPIYADSAEPKSIEDIHRAGFTIKPCVKGKDAVNIEVDFMRRYKLRVTKSSTNLIRELRGLTWMRDKNGELTNIIAKVPDHGFDAARYTLTSRISPGGTLRSLRIAI